MLESSKCDTVAFTGDYRSSKNPNAPISFPVTSEGHSRGSLPRFGNQLKVPTTCRDTSTTLKVADARQKMDLHTLGHKLEIVVPAMSPGSRLVGIPLLVAG